MIDLLVAGGGPSGLATAIFARQAGLSVRVLEPRAGVIDKACGEGLMPPAVDALQQLGVELPRSRPLHGIRYRRGELQAVARFPGGRPGLGVRRTVLHAAMGQRARELGVAFEQTRVQELRQSADRVQAAGHEARWLIAADGLRSSIRQQLGLGLPPRRPARLGIRRHFRVEPWSDQVEVYWSDRAEAYVTPVDQDLVDVAFLWFKDRPPPPDAQAPFQRLLASFPRLAARLAGAETASAVRGAGPFEQRLHARHQGRVLLVGDAAGYLDPLTGEGIRLGLATARAAIDAVRAGKPQRYEAAWHQLARPYWWSTAGLLALARHRLTRPLIVPAAARVPGLMRAAVAVLGG